MNDTSYRTDHTVKAERRALLPFFVTVVASILVAIIVATVLLFQPHFDIYVVLVTSVLYFVLICTPIYFVAYMVGAVFPAISKVAKVFIWVLLAMLISFYPAFVHFFFFTHWFS